MSRFYPLVVKDIRQITSRAVRVSFQIQETLKPIFQHVAGQYITMQKEYDGVPFRRSYSVCSSPKSGLLEIGVKEVKDGLFSRFINSELQKGDVLEVCPPEGRFIFIPEKDANRHVIAFAAGSGITPIMSIMKTVLEEEPNSTFVLVYGNKNSTGTMFYDEITQLKTQYSQRLLVYAVYSESEEEDALFGRIDRTVVNYILKNQYKTVVFDAFYLCGPEAMICTVTEVLQENNIEKKRIFFELFTIAETVQKIPRNTTGETDITVILDAVKTAFVMTKKQRILDAVLKEGLDPPYSCQGGVCSSCIAKLSAGEVTMVQNQILTDQELEDGFILTCQAHPVTDRVVIDYDDV